MTKYMTKDKVLITAEIERVDNNTTDHLPYLVKMKNGSNIWISENEIVDKTIGSNGAESFQHSLSLSDATTLDKVNAELDFAWFAVKKIQDTIWEHVHPIHGDSDSNTPEDFEVFLNKLSTARSELGEIGSFIDWAHIERDFKIVEKQAGESDD